MKPTSTAVISTSTTASPAPVTALPGDLFPELVRTVKQAGLLRRRRGVYIGLFVLTFLLVALGAAVFVVLGASWWQMLTAVFAGLVSTQIAFLGHDAGHRQIFARNAAAGGRLRARGGSRSRPTTRACRSSSPVGASTT